MDDNTILLWGKYQGRKMANVPAEYLIFLFDKGTLYGDVKEYVEENEDVLREEIKRQEKK